MATPRPYIPGQVVRLAVSIADVDGTAQDPGALRLMVKSPAGAVTLYTYGVDAALVRAAAGLYRADVPLAAAGQYRWRWEADAPFAGAAEAFLTVSPSLL